MALMVLRRFPTKEELHSTAMEAHTFIEAFNKHAISAFTARVEDKGDHVLLDKLQIAKGEWFDSRFAHGSM
jgi:ribosomal protein L25 (general stress protein Ctc)